MQQATLWLLSIDFRTAMATRICVLVATMGMMYQFYILPHYA